MGEGRGKFEKIKRKKHENTLTSKTGEAAAETVAPVALATASALIGLMTADGANLHGTEGGIRKGAQIEQSGPAGSASILALINEDLQLVLLALIRHTDEGDVNDNAVGINRRINTDTNLVDDPVGEREQSTLNVFSECGVISRPSDGLGDEGLIELGGEANSKGLAVKVGIDVVRIIQSNRLSLRHLVAMARQTQSRRFIVAGNYIEDVVAIRAHPVGASDAGPARVTDAGTSAVHVEGGAVKLLGARAQARQLEGGAVVVLIVNDAVGQVLHELARPMTRALVRAGLAGARLALVAGEAPALAGAAITGALPSALDVLVMASVGIGAVHPRQLVWAESTAAVAPSLAVHAPPRKAGTDLVRSAVAITAAKT